MSPRQWLDILHRRKWSVITMVVASAVVVTCMLASARPVYTTTARLLVDSLNFNVQQISGDNPLTNLINSGQEHGVATQTQIINSERFVKEVHRALGLSQQEIARISSLTAQPDGGESDIIVISIRSTDPTLAAKVATGAAQHYVDRAKASKLEALDRTQEYLTAQAHEADRKLNDARDRLTRFRLKTHLHPDEDAIKRLLEQKALMDTAARRTSDELTEVEAQLASARRQLSDIPATIGSDASSPNPEYALLQERLKRLEGQLAEKQTQYQEGSQEIRDLRQQIAEAKEQLRGVPAAIPHRAETANPERQRLQEQLGEIERRRDALKARMEQEQVELAPEAQKALQVVPWSAELEDLTRAKTEAEENQRDIFTKLRDLEVRRRAMPDSVKVLEEAHVPTSPVEPIPSKIIGMGIVLGLMLGLGLAFAQEYLDNRIHSPEDAESITAMPTLGVVPTIPTSRCPTLLPEDGHAVVTECYRAIRTAIQFSSVDCPVRSLVVTSSSPGEGKTVTSINLATVMAFQGYRVILIDADLRRPSIHKLLELDSTRGMSDVLAGEVALRDALKPTRIANLSALTCGSRVPNPAELLGSEAMTQLIHSLRQEADFVVFDTPPCLPVTDAEVLSSQVDGTVLVIECGRSQKEAVRTSMELLKQVRARVVGCVLNKIDQSKKGAYYHYYYYRGGYRYYGDRPAPTTTRKFLQLGSGSRGGEETPERRQR